MGVTLKAGRVTVGTVGYRQDSLGYPANPVIMSGVSVQWGADSCVDHEQPSTASLDLWHPYSAGPLPALGDQVSISATVSNGPGTTQTVPVFLGRIETITAQDDHKAGYRLSITASDVLALLARLRISDTPWPAHFVQVRWGRLQNALAGRVTVDAFRPEFIDNTTICVNRDVDAYPALEALQKTAATAGTTIQSLSNGHVAIAPALGTGKTFRSDQSTAPLRYSWLGTPYASASVERNSSNQIVRTNYFTGYRYAGGTGTLQPVWAGGSGNWYQAGVGTTWATRFAVGKLGPEFVKISFSNSASTAAGAGFISKETVSGVSGDKFSASAWVRVESTTQAVRLSIIFYNGATTVNTVTGATQTLTDLDWKLLTISGATAAGAYTHVALKVETTGTMPVGSLMGFSGACLTKTATAGSLFTGYTLDPAAGLILQDTTYGTGTPVVSIPAKAIRDDQTLMDQSRTINQVKVPHTSSADGTERATIFSTATRLDAPQARVLDSELAWGAPPAKGAIVTRAQLILSAQSTPRWRLSGPIRLVLSEVDPQAGLPTILHMDTRFAAPISLPGIGQVDAAQRIRGGRLVLGDRPVLEFDIEPADYAAPATITRDAMKSTSILADLTFQSAKASNVPFVSLLQVS